MRFGLAGLAMGMLLWSGCGEEAPPALSVGPVSFTEDELLGLSDARRETLADLTAFGLAVADSSTADLGAPQVAEWADDRLLEILAAELALEKNGVGEDVLEANYQTDPEWELTVRHILVFSERWRSAAHRETARAKAGRALELLRGGADFPAAEARLAEEPGAEARAGLLPPGREGAWVPEFWAAALALEPGELSPVTETQYGYHVLRLENRTIVPFAEARASVARRVAQTIEDPGPVLEAWMAGAGTDEVARRAAAVSEARTRGLEGPPGERVELQRRWDDQVSAWSAALGFTYGLPPDRVAEAAVAALARPGQTAEISRRELANHSGLLEARYEVRFGTESRAQP